MATENPRFGYTRIRDVVNGLGHEVGRNTLKRILAHQGIEPASEWGSRRPWKTFLRAHWDAVAGADFLSAEVLTWRGLLRHSVFFVLELRTRRVEIAGISCQPDGAWMKQLARNLTDAFDGFLFGKRFIFLDRDPLYTREFRRLLEGSGVKPLLLPAKSPKLNAHSERFVLATRGECQNHLVLLSEAQLRRAVSECVEHDHAERHHQGLDVALLEPREVETPTDGPVACPERLGGLLKSDHRQAA